MASRKINTLKKSRKFMASLREEQTGVGIDRDMEIKALANFLGEAGVNCGDHTNAALARLILDFLADHKTH